VIEGLQIAGRLGQYATILVLFGVTAFGLYAPGAAAFLPLRRLLGGALIAAFAASLVGLVGQTGAMSGSLADAVKPDMLWTIVSATHYGVAWTVRLIAFGLAVGALGMANARPQRALGMILHLSGLAAASLAWGGHGVEGEGLPGLAHLAADIAHIGAAGLWIGALVAFGLLMLKPGTGHLKASAQALANFAGAGTLIAAVLVLTGVINTAFLVPLRTIPNLSGNLWADVLAIKLVLFGGMLALAATNRFVLTPRLKPALSDPAREADAVRQFRLSVLSETTLAFCILGLVAWLGTLHPPLHGGG